MNKYPIVYSSVGSELILKRFFRFRFGSHKCVIVNGTYPRNVYIDSLAYCH